MASTTATHTGVLASLPFDVLGGRQRRPAGMRELDTSWYGYGAGVLARVDNGHARAELEYHSAEGTCGPEDPVLFKSATRVGDRLYACSQTELMVYSYPELELQHHVSHPFLNDVHHVLPSDNGLVAAVSGHDMVIELGLDGGLVNVWGVDGTDPVSRLDPALDYRIDHDLKPHAYHPNYLFRLHGELWATRFETRDAVAVHDVTKRIAIDRERCHDGVVVGDRVYFTTVDGYVIEVDASTHEVIAEHPLADDEPDRLLGWCRGLTFFDDIAVVGFSRIRHTKVRGALSWVRNRMTTSGPTRVAAYRLPSWTLVDELDLEPVGLNAVFTIVDRS